MSLDAQCRQIRIIIALMTAFCPVSLSTLRAAHNLDGP
jgi:hypothetical protein